MIHNTRNILIAFSYKMWFQSQEWTELFFLRILYKIGWFPEIRTLFHNGVFRKQFKTQYEYVINSVVCIKCNAQRFQSQWKPYCFFVYEQQNYRLTFGLNYKMQYCQIETENDVVCDHWLK